jgi:hypothetical protein
MPRAETPPDLEKKLRERARHPRLVGDIRTIRLLEYAAEVALSNRELIGLLEKKIRDGMAERFIAIADHIQENADALKKYEWEGNEARCRELCSMYIRELAHTIQMDEMLARIDAALKGGKE